MNRDTAARFDDAESMLWAWRDVFLNAENRDALRTTPRVGHVIGEQKEEPKMTIRERDCSARSDLPSRTRTGGRGDRPGHDQLDGSRGRDYGRPIQAARATMSRGGARNA